MNSCIRRLVVLFLAAAVTTGPLAIVTSDLADARRGGGHRGGHGGHHGGHHVKPRPGHGHHGGRHHHGHDRYHRYGNHYGRWAAGAVVAGATAAAINSVYYSRPCGTTVVRNGRTYYRCGGVWYRPRYQGSNVTYVVVNAP